MYSKAAALGLITWLFALECELLLNCCAPLQDLLMEKVYKGVMTFLNRVSLCSLFL